MNNKELIKQIEKDINYDLKNKIDPLHSLINLGFAYDSKGLEKDLRELLEAIALTYYNRGYQEIEKEIKERINNLPNPYPKDVFKWDKNEKLNFNRGRFNKHCFEIWENCKQKLLKSIGETNEINQTRKQNVLVA